MSLAIMEACWPLTMPPTAKAVLISLADNAKDTGQCWPAISTICERTCFGKTAVIDAIAWLEAAGALQANRQNGRHTSYSVTPQNYVKPERQTDRSGKQTGSPAGVEPDRLADNRTGRRSAPVREADTNRKEPSLKATVKATVMAPEVAVLLAGIPAELVTDFLKLRKAKHAPLTVTAIKGICREAEKAGVTLEQALDTCCQRGWAGFKAEWVARDGPAKPLRPDGKPSAAADFRNTTYTGTPYDELPPELR